jgi:N-acetylmuramoyl-L-alanine amidase
MVDMRRDPRTISSIIIHCSDSDRPEDDNIEMIRSWHLLKNWSDVAYHYFIDKHGKVHEGRKLDQVGAHCIGHNLQSIGICLSGKKDFWEPQFRSLYFLITQLMTTYKIPKSQVYPHNHFNIAKSCPNFAIEKIWRFENKKD